MWGYHDTMGWWWVIPMAAFWVTVLWLVLGGAKIFSGNREAIPVAVETPLEVAQRRLAKGEISAEEYEDLRRWLE